MMLAFGMALTTICATLQPFSIGTVTIVSLLAVVALSVACGDQPHEQTTPTPTA